MPWCTPQWCGIDEQCGHCIFCSSQAAQQQAGQQRQAQEVGEQPLQAEMELRKGDLPHHSHSRLSFQDYCTTVNQPKWEDGLRLSGPVRPTGSDALARVHEESAAYLGYTKVDACVS